MPGLGPGIHALPLENALGDEGALLDGVDGRVKPGHDGDIRGVIFAWK